MVDFLNSNGLQTITTLLVGTLAWLVYVKQKRDAKVDEARSIVLEIQNAESALSKVRDAVKSGHLDVDVRVLQSESWSVSKRLFVRDFDRDEWDLISDFFNRAALIDDAIRYNKTAFASDVEQIRTNKQATFARFAADVVEKLQGSESVDEIQKNYELKAKAFDGLYMNNQEDFQYKPLKPLNDVKLYLDGMSNLSASVVGLKFKKIAKLL